MFQIQNPEQLARVGQGRLAQERSTDVAELEVLRQREMAEKKSRALQRGSRRAVGAAVAKFPFLHCGVRRAGLTFKPVVTRWHFCS